MMKTNKKNRCSGFSLIEILVVITILASLASIVAINVFGQQEEAQIKQARIEIRTLENALQQFKAMENRFPSKSEGLLRLTEPCGRAKRPLLDQVPIDPWGNPYIYKSALTSGELPVVLTYGADGKVGGEGVNEDISNMTLRAERNVRKK
jgi:general secretion pathway protein G